MSLLYRLSLALLLAAGVGLSACAVDQDDNAGTETRVAPMGGPADDNDADVNIDAPDAPDAPDVDVDAPDAPDEVDIETDD